jgi:prolyl-tRNA synthetase
MSHSDNRGIIIPPKIAPNQIDILPLFSKKNVEVEKESKKMYKILSRSFRVRIDVSNKGVGFKASNSEIQGTPLRIEVGPRDLKENLITLIRRDTLEKKQINIYDIKKEVKKILLDIQKNLYEKAKKMTYNNIVKVTSYDEFKNHINNKKFVLVPFIGNAQDEEKIQKETGATARCIPFEFKIQKNKKCFFTNKKTKRLVLFARAY